MLTAWLGRTVATTIAKGRRMHAVDAGHRGRRMRYQDLAVVSHDAP